MKEKKEKKITITVKNKQLNSLEDLLFSEITDKQKAKFIKDVKKLWVLMVKAYNKK